MTIRGPLERSDLPRLLERARILLQTTEVEVLHCELLDVPADALAADALARLALIARRQGCRVRLRGCSRELRALVDLVGLAEIFFG